MHKKTFKQHPLFITGLTVLLLALSHTAEAAVERYKVEVDYLADLSGMGYVALSEGFESSAWDAVRSSGINDINSLPSVVSKGITWESAARDLWSYPTSRIYGLTTNGNWARSGSWGMYEDHKGDPMPTTIRITFPQTVYGIGGFFDTNPDFEAVGFLFEGATTAEDPGYVVAGIGAMYSGDNAGSGHNFNGLIVPDGFTEVILTGVLEINEENQLEGGAIYGIDDFTFAVPSGFVPEPTSFVLLMMSGFFMSRSRSQGEGGELGTPYRSIEKRRRPKHYDRRRERE